MRFPDRTSAIVIITGALTAVFVLFLFFVPLKGKHGAAKQVLLNISDCYNELPTKGFIFVGIAVVLAAILYAFNLHKFFSRWAAETIPSGVSPFGLLFLISLATSFSTEVLSNTAVQLSFFVMALPLAETLNFSALGLLIIITLACTSAFMSPIATGVNGLAFGGVKGVSFSRMLLVGFVMNVAGALLVSIWTFFYIGRLYGLN
jgi:sodium-dependent dicarboxylate transporter 2/3/5